MLIWSLKFTNVVSMQTNMYITVNKDIIKIPLMNSHLKKRIYDFGGKNEKLLNISYLDILTISGCKQKKIYFDGPITRNSMTESYPVAS